MNILRLISSVFITGFMLCSCSKGEEYNPQVASAVLNTLCMSILDNQGKPVDNSELLTNHKISVIGKNSKREASIDVTDYEGTNMLRFKVDLPDVKAMVYNSDRSEATGTVDLVMNIKGTKLPMSVVFLYVPSNDATMVGGNSIRIKSIKFSDQTIVPTEKLGINLIKVIYDDKNTTIEPW